MNEKCRDCEYYNKTKFLEHNWCNYEKLCINFNGYKEKKNYWEIK